MSAGILVGIGLIPYQLSTLAALVLTMADEKTVRSGVSCPSCGEQEHVEQVTKTTFKNNIY